MPTPDTPSTPRRGLRRAILAVIAAAWGVALHNRRAHEGEFASGEPETMEEIHLHPTDVHTDDDPPSSM